MKSFVKIVGVVLIFIIVGCETESIEAQDKEFGIEQQGVDKSKIERPGTQGDD